MLLITNPVYGYGHEGIVTGDIDDAGPVRIYSCWPLVKSNSAICTFIFWVSSRNRASAENYFALLFKLFEPVIKIDHPIDNASNLE